MTDIKDWIQKSPNTNRRKLCKRFEDDNEFVYQFSKKHPQYREFIKHFINTSQYAYRWAREFGDQDYMKHKIVEPSYAYFWAHNIGNQDFMKPIVEKSGDAVFIGFWNSKFEDDQI